MVRCLSEEKRRFLRGFRRLSEDVPKISEGCPTTIRGVADHFRRCSEDFPKISEGFRRCSEDFPRGSRRCSEGARGVPEGFWEGGAPSGLSGKSGALPGRVGSAGGAQGYFTLGTGLYFSCVVVLFYFLCHRTHFLCKFFSGSLIGPFVPRGTKCCSLIGGGTDRPRILLAISPHST